MPEPSTANCTQDGTMSLLALVVITAIKSLIIIVVLLTAFAYLTYLERKVQAAVQVRLGPDRAGPWGILQPIADAIKMITKEDIIPTRADKVLFVLAPVISLTMALSAFAAIPVGPPIELFGYTVDLAVADVKTAYD